MKEAWRTSNCARITSFVNVCTIFKFCLYSPNIITMQFAHSRQFQVVELFNEGFCDKLLWWLWLEVIIGGRGVILVFLLGHFI